MRAIGVDDPVLIGVGAVFGRVSGADGRISNLGDPEAKLRSR